VWLDCTASALLSFLKKSSSLSFTDEADEDESVLSVELVAREALAPTLGCSDTGVSTRGDLCCWATAAAAALTTDS